MFLCHEYLSSHANLKRTIYLLMNNRSFFPFPLQICSFPLKRSRSAAAALSDRHTLKSRLFINHAADTCHPFPATSGPGFVTAPPLAQVLGLAGGGRWPAETSPFPWISPGSGAQGEARRTHTNTHARVQKVPLTGGLFFFAVGLIGA